MVGRKARRVAGRETLQKGDQALADVGHCSDKTPQDLLEALVILLLAIKTLYSFLQIRTRLCTT